MPSKGYHLLTLIPLFLSVTSFELTFFENEIACTGQNLGTWIGGEGQGCSTDFVGLAGGVEIRSTGPVDDSTVAKFYSSGDCATGTEIASGSGGCIGIDGQIAGSYKSFNVVAEKATLPQSSPTRTVRKDRKRYTMANCTETTGVTPWITHGQFATYDGIEYRWQQIHSVGWIGIAPDEWDDDLHIKNDTELQYDKESFTPNSNYTSRSSLDKRVFLNSICQATTTCVRLGSAAGVKVNDAIAPYLASAKAAAAVSVATVEAFLERNPYLAIVSAQTLGNILSSPATALVGAKIQGSGPSVASCSDLKDSIDALASVIQNQKTVTVTADAVTVKILIEPSDAVSALTVSVVTCNNQPPPDDGCGVTVGMCGVSS